jgi:magnesium transporter
MSADTLSASSQTKIQKHKNVAWTDVQNPDQSTLKQLERDYHLHPVHLDESIEKLQLTGVEREDSYVFLLLHLPVRDPTRDKILVEQIGIFIGKDYLITIHTGQCPLLNDLFELFEQSSEHQQEYIQKGPGYLLYGIVKQVLDVLSNITQEVLNELDSIEDLVFDDNIDDAYRIGKARQKIIRLRRIIGSLREVLAELHQQTTFLSSEHMSKYYANNVKMANKLWDVIGEAGETIEVFKDADFTTSTEQTNKTLAVLTLVFTLTIPITVLGTLYGMNVPLPGGLVTGPWTLFGRYTSLMVVLAVSALGAGWMYAYFRKSKWL